MTHTTLDKIEEGKEIYLCDYHGHRISNHVYFKIKPFTASFGQVYRIGLMEKDGNGLQFFVMDATSYAIPKND